MCVAARVAVFRAFCMMPACNLCCWWLLFCFLPRRVLNMQMLSAAAARNKELEVCRATANSLQKEVQQLRCVP